MKAVVEKTKQYYKYIGLSDLTLVGTPTVDNYVVNGFNTSNYVILNNNFLTAISTANSFEFVFKFTTGNDVSTIQFIFYQGVSRTALGYNGIGLQVRGDIVSYPTIHWGYSYSQDQQGISGSNRIYPNTTYWAKMEFFGNRVNTYISTDGKNWLLDSFLTDALKLQASSYNTTLGCSVENNASPIYPFFGSIDLKNCYIKIDNTLWWQGCEITEGTSSDYDFYKEVIKRELPKNNFENKYYAIKSYEKRENFGGNN